MKNFTLKQIAILGVICIIVFGTIGLYIFKNRDNSEEFWEELEDAEIQYENDEFIVQPEGDVEEKIIIHITGCIQNQGIITLDQGDRIVDAIEMAGGTTEDADLNKINLAYELQDGEKLYIPSKDDKEDIEYLSRGENNYVESMVEKGGENVTININTANQEQLQKLNGIGESMAKKIIKYREENGKFKNIEDIKSVPGIGDAKFNGIKENITVKLFYIRFITYKNSHLWLYNHTMGENIK